MSELASYDQPTFASVAPGEIIGGRYRVEGPIGEGGMGVVCRATHLTLQTSVAIKLIRPDFKDDTEFVRRFLNEARRAAALKSERITRVHDVGQLESGEPYLVMELLEGIELEQYLNEHGPLPALDAANVALQICEGLAEAHASGIVHRDIKPSNAFLARRADGRFSVKILDFGISKQMVDGSTSITNGDQSLGSPQYMSPEQMLDPSSVDHRSDIWSVGVVLFELLTGQRPFDGASVPEVCAKVLTAPASTLRSVRPSIDPELEAIVMQCLEKDPALRYPDIVALGQALQRYVCIHADSGSRLVETSSFFEPVVDAVADELGSLPPLARAPAPFERRLRRAHFFGAFGIVATLALAGFAFGGSSLAAAHGVSSRLVTQWQNLPELKTGPEPAPLERGDESYPLMVAADSALAEPEHESSAESSADADEPTAEDVAPPPAQSMAPAHASARPNDYLPPAEIRRRIERYQRWLDEQGLMRLDAIGDQPSFMGQP
jgi:eukaryotic-like serine/threonine-protein kinase